MRAPMKKSLLLLLPTSECLHWSLTNGYIAWPPSYILMEKSIDGYSKAYNWSQSKFKWFNILQVGGKMVWVGNGGGKKGWWEVIVFPNYSY